MRRWREILSQALLPRLLLQLMCMQARRFPVTSMGSLLLQAIPLQGQVAWAAIHVQA